MKLVKNKKGQSLIEMLVALTIVVVSLLGMFVLVSRALGVNKIASEQYTATYLAAEGIEIARNMFDRSYIVAQDSAFEAGAFYGWVNPGDGKSYFEPGLYEIQYSESEFFKNGSSNQVPITVNCPFSTQIIPTRKALERIFKNCTIRSLNFDENTGIYSYNAGVPTKYKRVLMIDNPHEYNFKGIVTNLDFRVTSVVFTQTRTGVFAIQLQDHFMPWRIP